MESVTNGIISVMVDVNELCAGGSNYTILVNIVDSTNIIERNITTFKDRTFVFDQLSPGDYVCNIIVMNASGVILSSREIEDCDIPFPTTTCKKVSSRKFFCLVFIFTCSI